MLFYFRYNLKNAFSFLIKVLCKGNFKIKYQECRYPIYNSTVRFIQFTLGKAMSRG